MSHYFIAASVPHDCPPDCVGPFESRESAEQCAIAIAAAGRRSFVDGVQRVESYSNVSVDETEDETEEDFRKRQI